MPRAWGPKPLSSCSATVQGTARLEQEHTMLDQLKGEQHPIWLLHECSNHKLPVRVSNKHVNVGMCATTSLSEAIRPSLYDLATSNFERKNHSRKRFHSNPSFHVKAYDAQLCLLCVTSAGLQTRWIHQLCCQYKHMVDHCEFFIEEKHGPKLRTGLLLSKSRCRLHKAST